VLSMTGLALAIRNSLAPVLILSRCWPAQAMGLAQLGELTLIDLQVPDSQPRADQRRAEPGWIHPGRASASGHRLPRRRASGCLRARRCSRQLSQWAPLPMARGPCVNRRTRTPLCSHDLAGHAFARSSDVSVAVERLCAPVRLGTRFTGGERSFAGCRLQENRRQCCSSTKSPSAFNSVPASRIRRLLCIIA
jgi:hypothetical protein